MFTPASLPYTSPDCPVPLPTTPEIRTCPNVLHERHGGCVVAMNDRVVVKFGSTVMEGEGQALIYLERYVPDVPAPQLYSMYRDGNQLFLVMQRISGKRLDLVWDSFTNSEKDLLTEELRRAFVALRAAETPWPKDFFGGSDGGSVRHWLFYDQKGGKDHLGPFVDEAAFVKGLTGNYRALCERNGHALYKVQFWEQHLSEMLRSHRPVLTHGDLHKRNVLVVEKEDKSELNGGQRKLEVVLLDWEMAGWLPEFWEYFTTFMYFRIYGWEDDWCSRVGQFLPVYLAETAVMEMFDRDAGV